MSRLHHLCDNIISFVSSITHDPVPFSILNLTNDNETMTITYSTIIGLHPYINDTFIEYIMALVNNTEAQVTICELIILQIYVLLTPSLTL